MADGSIRIEVSAEIKAAQKEINKLSGDILKQKKAINELTEAYKNNADSLNASFSAGSKKLSRINNDLREAKLELEGMKEAFPNLEKARQFELAHPKTKEKGLVAANLKNWGLTKSQLDLYKQQVAIVNEQTTAQKQQESVVKNIQEKLVASETEYKMELSTETEKLNNLVKQRQSYVDLINDSVQKENRFNEILSQVQEEEKVKEQAAQQERERRKQEREESKALYNGMRDNAISAISKITSQFQMLAQSGIGKADSALKVLLNKTVFGFVGGFKKATKGVAKFAKQLKNAAMQGLLFRPLRNALSKLSQQFMAGLRTNAQFNAALGNLKGTFLSALAPAINAVLPIISNLINYFATAITYISTFINAIFGLKKATIAEAKALDKAQSAGGGGGNDKATASWDTLQQLSTGDSGGAGTGVAATYEQDFSAAEDALKAFKDELELGEFYKAGQELGNFLDGFVKKYRNKLSELKGITQEKLTNIAQFINGFFSEGGFDFSGLGAAFGETLIFAFDSVSTWLSQVDWERIGASIVEFITGIDWLGLIHSAFDLLLSALSASFKLIKGLIKRAGDFVLDFIIGLFSSIGVDLGWLKDLFDTYIDFIVDIWTDFFSFLKGDISFKEFCDKANERFENFREALKVALDNIVGYFKIAWEYIKEVWGKVKEWFVLSVIDPIKDKFNALKTAISDAFKLAWDKVKEVWGNVKQWFTEKVVDPIKNAFETVKTNIKGVFNGIIGIVESALNLIIDKMNTLSWDIPDFVPFVGGEKFGFDFNRISIPRLAQGTVVNPSHEFAAILGDNRHEQEVVSPLSTMKQALIEALQDSGYGRTGDIVLEIDGSTFARLTNPYMKRESNRVGISVTGGY